MQRMPVRPRQKPYGIDRFRSVQSRPKDPT
nr:MAG TPA: hypothetical protein [Caudoviricetes sp.]